MGKTEMYGVVLWTDSASEQAVIWCEDQGELAFYRRGPDAIDDPALLSAGDLIRFDLATASEKRSAVNPQLVAQGQCRDLPRALRAAARGMSKVVPFPNVAAGRRLCPA